MLAFQRLWVRGALGLSAVMLTGFGAGWALAQMGSQTEMDTGSRIARPVPAVIPHHIKPTDDDSRLVTSAFGVCVVRAHRAMVERVLALPRFGKGTWHAFAVLADEKCLNSGTLAMPTDLLRGSLYAALYAIDFRVAPSVQITEPLDYKPDVAGAEPAAAQSYLALHDFGDCVVRADTATTRALVLSPVGSAAEGENFARLASRFSGCIVQGQTITFSKSVLSAVLAETLYRSTKAAVAASTTVAPPAIPVR